MVLATILKFFITIKFIHLCLYGYSLIFSRKYASVHTLSVILQITDAVKI